MKHTNENEFEEQGPISHAFADYPGMETSTAVSYFKAKNVLEGEIVSAIEQMTDSTPEGDRRVEQRSEAQED